MRLGRGEQPAQPLDLGPGRRPAGPGQPVVAAALVVEVRGRPLVGLLDQPVAQQPAQRAVERRGAQPRIRALLRLDHLHDLVAVPVAVGQRQQDVERRLGQPRCVSLGHGRSLTDLAPAWL
jgi:hypothetical protein